MGKFSLFNVSAATSLVALSISEQSFARMEWKVDCYNFSQDTIITFFDTDIKPGKDYVYFRRVRIGNRDFYNGTGSAVGRGEINESSLDLEITWTYTGADTSSVLGRLIGEKKYGKWTFKMIPWNIWKEKYEPNKTVGLNYCTGGTTGEF